MGSLQEWLLLPLSGSVRNAKKGVAQEAVYPLRGRAHMLAMASKGAEGLSA